MSSSDGDSSSNPTVALLLSGLGLFFPILSGAGQMYNGDVGRGLAFTLVQCIHFLVVFFTFWLIIPIFTYLGVGAYFAYDAYNTAQPSSTAQPSNAAQADAE